MSCYERTSVASSVTVPIGVLLSTEENGQLRQFPACWIQLTTIDCPHGANHDARTENQVDCIPTFLIPSPSCQDAGIYDQLEAEGFDQLDLWSGKIASEGSYRDDIETGGLVFGSPVRTR